MLQDPHHVYLELDVINNDYPVLPSQTTSISNRGCSLKIVVVFCNPKNSGGTSKIVSTRKNSGGTSKIVITLKNSGCFRITTKIVSTPKK